MKRRRATGEKKEDEREKEQRGRSTERKNSDGEENSLSAGGDGGQRVAKSAEGNRLFFIFDVVWSFARKDDLACTVENSVSPTNAADLLSRHSQPWVCLSV